MKTIEDLKNIINQEQKFIEKQRELKITKGTKPASKKIMLCKTVINYLESNPKKEWLEGQKFLLQCQIRNALEKYDYWLKHCCTENSLNKQKNLFNKENGITRKRQQIRFINFILNK